MKPVILGAILWLSALTQGLAAGTQGFAIHDAPQDVANFRFVTEDGTWMDLEGFRGRVILVNVWATWCPPCVKEMPTLDALQDALGGPEFEVVALSIDNAGPDVVRDFFDRIGVRNLNMYVDETMLSFTALRVVGLPTTLLINAEGKEIGRLIGPAEWNDPEMVAFLKSHIK